MKKPILYVLIGIIALLTGYLLFSRSNSTKEIKQLTEKLNEKVDSLVSISFKLDSISRDYDSIYTNLKVRSEQLVILKNGLDSIMGSNITNVTSVKNALLKLSVNQKKYPEIDTTNSPWRF